MSTFSPAWNPSPARTALVPRWRGRPRDPRNHVRCSVIAKRRRARRRCALRRSRQRNCSPGRPFAVPAVDSRACVAVIGGCDSDEEAAARVRCHIRNEHRVLIQCHGRCRVRRVAESICQESSARTRVRRSGAPPPFLGPECWPRCRIPAPRAAHPFSAGSADFLEQQITEPGASRVRQGEATFAVRRVAIWRDLPVDVQFTVSAGIQPDESMPKAPVVFSA